jgi:hypothetical protein
MADAEEKAKAEKMAAARKRVCVLSIPLSKLDGALSPARRSDLLCIVGRADKETETKESWCQEGGKRLGPGIFQE